MGEKVSCERTFQIKCVTRAIGTAYLMTEEDN